jgi:hypothetical protein
MNVHLRSRRSLMFVLRDLVIALGVRRMVLYVGTAAAATVATLTLTGTVPQRLQITVTPTAAASGMNLVINQPAIKVADLNGQTNWPFGYTVTVASENVTAARCTTPCFFSPSQTDTLNFVLYRGTTPLTFSGSEAEFVATAAKSAHSGDPYDVQVSYNGAAIALTQATDYIENLTFTISNN